MGRRGKIKVKLIFLDFLIILLLTLIPFYLIIFYNLQLKMFKVAQAKIVTFILTIFGISAVSYENYIMIENKIFEVSWDSTGWKSIYLLVVLIFAVPLKFKYKWKYLLLAPILTFFINLLRLVLTIYCVIILNFEFEFFHLFLWRYFMGIYVLIFWFLFLCKQKYNIGQKTYIVGRIYEWRK